MTECPYCETDDIDCLEYDADEDLYNMQCVNGHNYWVECEDEVWK